MNSSVKYFAKKVGTELVVSGLILGIVSGVKFASRKFFARRTEKEVKARLQDA